MESVEYQFEREHVSAFARLIRDVYTPHPLFAEARVAEAQRSLNEDNPFLRFGTWRSFLIHDGGRPVAHITAIIDRRLPIDVGLVGYFDSLENPVFAQEAFRFACGFLAGKGVRRARGPVDLTTWRGFRVSYPEGPPPFLLEPFTRGYYRDLFEGCGFAVAQLGISTVGTIGRMDLERCRSSHDRLRGQGLSLERVEAEDLPNLLPEIWQLSREAFRGSWSYVPLSFDEFAYNSGPSVDPSLFVDIARERKGGVVAFTLSARDRYAEKGKRVVAKTAGVLPVFQGRGIGRALLGQVCLRAEQDGMEEVVFSTMRSDNAIMRNLTGPALDVVREYAVYELRL